MKKLLNLSLFALILTSCAAQTTKNETSVGVNDASDGQQICQRIDKKQFRDGIAKGNVQVLDVRTPEETSEGMNEEAITINFYDANFREQVSELDRSIPVYVYCRSGGRSQKAMEVLKDLGFSVVYELSDGYMNY